MLYLLPLNQRLVRPIEPIHQHNGSYAVRSFANRDGVRFALTDSHIEEGFPAATLSNNATPNWLQAYSTFFKQTKQLNEKRQDASTEHRLNGGTTGIASTNES